MTSRLAEILVDTLLWQTPPLSSLLKNIRSHQLVSNDFCFASAHSFPLIKVLPQCFKGFSPLMQRPDRFRIRPTEQMPPVSSHPDQPEIPEHP